jgi:hypothetical protein
VATVPYAPTEYVAPRERVPRDYEHIEAPIGAFGGFQAEALEKLGQGLTSAGALYGKVAAQNASNNYEDAVTKMLFGDPSKTSPDGTPDRGLMGLRGQDALNAASTMNQKLIDLRQQFGGSLWSADQELLYNNETARTFRYALEMAGRHYDSQFNDYATATNKTTADLALTGIRNDPNNPDSVSKNIDKLTRAYMQDAQLRFGHNLTNDQVQDVTNKAQTDAVENQIEALMPTNPAKAQQLLESPAGRLLRGPRYDSLNWKLQNLNNRNDDDAIVRGIFGGSLRGALTTPSGNEPTQITGDINQTAGTIRKVLSDRGWSDAAINGALANGLAESNLAPWGAPGSAGERGIWQFNPASHLPQYRQFAQDQGKDVQDIGAQTNYMANWVESHMPGYAQSNNVNTATDQFLHQFEAPQNPVSRANYIPAAQRAGIGAPPEARPQGAPPFDQVIGDSIAHGIQNITKVTGDTKDGRTAQEVLDTIRNADPALLKGKSVFLSSGASNSPDALNLVPQQIQALKNAGANPILAGVGSGVRNYQQVNDTLAQYAKDAGIPFTGELATTAGGRVHPSDYGAVVQQVAQLHSTQPQLTGQQPQPAPPAQNPDAPPGFPTKEELIAKIPPNVDDAQYNRLFNKITRTYNQMLQATSAERAQVTAQYKGGLAMLADGRDFEINEQKIRSLFPHDVADEMIGNLHDAQTIGAEINNLHGMSPDDILKQKTANQQVLANSTGEDYLRQSRLNTAFDKALEQHLKLLGIAGTADEKRVADPAGYVVQHNADLQAAQKLAADNQNMDHLAWNASTGQQMPAETFADKLLAEEARLGVPSEGQHVLSRADAPNMVRQILADPEKAPDVMRSIAQHWGTAWDHVFRDLVTEGKLPVGFQSVGILDDQRDAALLARGLSEQSRSGKEWTDILGSKPVNDIKTAVRGDPSVMALVDSLQKSGATVGNIDSIVGSIDTLAYAKAFYDRDPSAAQDAIKSFVSKYEFMPNGGARVPAKNFDAVSANAAQTLTGLSTGSIGIPNVYLQDNFAQAKTDLNLTPQEINLYQHHLTNLSGNGKVIQPNGDISTVLQETVEHDGKTYNIPTVWDGKILPPDQAEARAAAAGWDKWPSYANEQDAEARYNQMHAYMNKDVGNFKNPATPQAQDYINQVRAAPSWITSPKADALWLMDWQGRLVRDRSGNPVNVPFDKPAPQQVAPVIPPQAPF